mmetsp:Transcript_22253/g.50199  ORF Transcript_22253/g.50199 Transcript_22253/m.50199 type:complete len:233 (-) Transcript_22253:459-1157(-)
MVAVRFELRGRSDLSRAVPVLPAGDSERGFEVEPLHLVGDQDSFHPPHHRLELCWDPVGRARLVDVHANPPDALHNHRSHLLHGILHRGDNSWMEVRRAQRAGVRPAARLVQFHHGCALEHGILGGRQRLCGRGSQRRNRLPPGHRDRPRDCSPQLWSSHHGVCGSGQQLGGLRQRILHPHRHGALRLVLRSCPWSCAVRERDWAVRQRHGQELLHGVRDGRAGDAPHHFCG